MVQATAVPGVYPRTTRRRSSIGSSSAVPDPSTPRGRLWSCSTSTGHVDGSTVHARPRSSASSPRGGEDQARPRTPPRTLEAAKPEDLAYLLTDSLGRLGITRTELVRDAEIFWRERFFTDDYLTHDVEVPGAAAFARDCYEAGGILVYFTGRDLPLMGLGSFASLRDLGFPIGVPGTELVLKPDAGMPDEAFKRMSGPSLARVGRVVAIFEQGRAGQRCNACCSGLRTSPEADTVFVDTQHLPGAPELAETVRVIADFRR